MATAIVVAGAGARGAYEAGVLSVVVPRLYDEGERELVLIGTSAGAINVAIVAASAHAPSEIGGRLKGVWTRLRERDVFDLKQWNLFFRGLGFLALGKRRVPLYELLDTSALPTTIDSDAHVDWNRLRSNIGRTWVKAAGVVATHVATGGSFVFLQSPGPLPEGDPERGITYVPVELDGRYVRASAAIPIAFPGVRVPVPFARGTKELWFSDGGTRLNTPIKPAADILHRWPDEHVKRVIVVGTHPAPGSMVAPLEQASEDEPDVIDEAASILHSIFVDRVAEDLHSLRRRNELLKKAGHRSLATSTGRYEVMPYAYFGPEGSGTIARAAKDVFGAKYACNPGSDFAIVQRFLGGQSASGNELLSYLFFDPAFLSKIFEQGQSDATRSIASGIQWTT